MESHVDGHCPGCVEDIEALQEVLRFINAALRFIAVGTPIALGIASFIVLVTK